MENTTPQITSLATLRSHPAAPAGFEGPDWTCVFPCEDGQALEQAGPAHPPMGVCFEWRLAWVISGGPVQPSSSHQEREQPPSCVPLTHFNTTRPLQPPFYVTLQ